MKTESLPNFTSYQPLIMEVCTDTLWPMYVSKGNLIAWSVTIAALIPLSVILNVVLIVAMFKTGEIKSFTSHFVILMSLSDMGLGAVVLPMIFSMLTFDKLRTNCKYQKAVLFSVCLFAYTSFFMLMAIAMDRYFLITKLAKYKSVMTKFRFKIIVVVIMLASLSCAVVTSISYTFCLHMIFVSTIVVVIGTIYVLYAKLVRHIDRRSNTVTRCNASTNERLVSRKSIRRKRDVSVVKTVKLLLAMIFVLYMPYNIISSVWSYYRFQVKQNPGNALNIAEFWSYVLIYLNCSANAVIYGHGNGKIRRYVKSIFCKGLRDKTNFNRTNEDTESEFSRAQEERNSPRISRPQTHSTKIVLSVSSDCVPGNSV